jgi:BirA family biotin operon repressor/biotin-[acetyl-CoA-carboxylase] ligase
LKEKILKLLKQNQGVYISGQDISAQLGITRAAVWKYIKQLESEGYIIESVTKKGYKLSQCPDILTYEEVGKLLNTKIMGRKIAHFKILDSTNNKARELAENGEPEGTIVIAEEQDTQTLLKRATVTWPRSSSAMLRADSGSATPRRTIRAFWRS